MHVLLSGKGVFSSLLRCVLGGKEAFQRAGKNYFRMGLDNICLHMQHYAMTTTETNKRMNQGTGLIDQIASECLLMRVRKLDRVLTSIYDAELRPFGLKARDRKSTRLNSSHPRLSRMPSSA